MLTTLEQIACQENKIPALTEFGYPEVPDSTWWIKVLWKVRVHHKIAYALAWRNASYKSSSGQTEFLFTL